MAKSRQASVRPQPLIAVQDVKSSSACYQTLLGLDSLPDHPHRLFYDRLMSGDTLILQLHRWDDEQHPNLMERDKAPAGHGVLVWFEIQTGTTSCWRAPMGRPRDQAGAGVRRSRRRPWRGRGQRWSMR